jgi:hypothetical protein
LRVQAHRQDSPRSHSSPRLPRLRNRLHHNHSSPRLPPPQLRSSPRLPRLPQRRLLWYKLLNSSNRSSPHQPRFARFLKKLMFPLELSELRYKLLT